jgi:uncharacterized protein
MDHVEAVRGVYEAFGRGDIPSILALLADDIEWDQDAPAYGVRILEPGVGKPHVGRFFAAVAEDLEFLKFEPTNFLAGGDQVAVTINARSRVKPTGNVYEMLEIHLWTFGNDGKVSRFFHCIDRHAMVLAYDV